MKDQFCNYDLEKKGQRNDQKVMRLFDLTHYAEKQLAKELQTNVNQANKNQLLMQIFIIASCGILAVAFQLEMSQEYLRYNYNQNILYLSIILFICFFMSGIIATFVIKHKGDFKKSNKLVLILISFYLICSQFIFFEISMMCKLYINPFLIILMNNQAKLFVYTISPNRAHFLYVGLIHLMLLYASLRIHIEFQIFTHSIFSSIIIYFLIIISFISQLIQRRFNKMEKSFREKLIAAQQKEIINIKKFYTNILQYMPHGIAIIDEQMQVLFANSNLHSILNCSKTEDLFQSLNQLNFADLQNFNANIQDKQNIHPQNEQLNGTIHINNAKAKNTLKSQIQNKQQCLKSNQSIFNEGLSISNINNTALLNQDNKDDIEIDIHDISIQQHINGLTHQGDQSVIFDCEVKGLNKRNTVYKEENGNKINESFQPTQDNPISQYSNKDISTTYSFRQILHKVFTSQTKQMMQNINLNETKQDKNLQQQEQQKNEFQQNKEFHIQKLKQITNNCFSQFIQPQKDKNNIKTKINIKDSMNGISSILTNNQNNSPDINSKQHLSNIEQTPQKKSFENLDKDNLYQEETCEIEASSNDGKKLNIKFVLYDLDLQKQIDDAFNSINNLTLFCEYDEKEPRSRNKTLSQTSQQTQKNYNQTPKEHQQQKNNSQITKKDQEQNGSKNYKMQSYQNFCEEKLSKGNGHEQLIVMIIEDQSQAQKVKRLEDQNEYKMRMLASVSHELRTPLNCSISMLQIMREYLTNMNQHDMIKNNLDPALYSSKILLNLINDILDFAQLEAGKFKITRQDFSLKKILQECLLLISIQSKMKNINLCLQIGNEENEQYDTCEKIESAFDLMNPINQVDKFMIHSDPNRVRQIVLNLLSNALKFTSSGQITLKAEILFEKPLTIKIICEDTGIGIPPERYSTIFDNFNKADLQNRIKYNQCGAGLGLSISNQLAKMLSPVENQNQPIVVVSQVGKGSQFSFIIQDQLPEELLSHSKNLNERRDDELHIISEESKKDNEIENSICAKYEREKEKDMTNNSTDNASVRSYKGYAKAFSQKKSQFGKTFQTATIDETIDSPKNSNQTTFIQSTHNINFAHGPPINADIQFLKQKQENYRKNQEMEINQQYSFQNSDQINDQKTCCNVSNHSQRSPNNSMKRSCDPYNINSPTDYHPMRYPKLFEVNQNSLQDKKKTDDQDQDHISRVMNSPYKPLSARQLSYGFSLQKEQTFVSNQNTVDSNQNYMYSYSLNSTINLQQQQSGLTLNLENRDSIKNGISKSTNMSRHQKSSFKTLEEFKQYHRQKKCNHPQVLVVDDNQFNVIAIQQQINKLDLQIDMSFSGESALQKIQDRFNKKYSCCPFYLLIFMDIDMPVMNGYETTQLIQNFFQENRIPKFECPVIACSAYVNPEDKQKAYESGMLDYITKPIMLGTLDKVFTNWFVQPQTQTQTGAIEQDL